MRQKQQDIPCAGVVPVVAVVVLSGSVAQWGAGQRGNKYARGKEVLTQLKLDDGWRESEKKYSEICLRGTNLKISERKKMNMYKAQKKIWMGI